MLKSVLRVLCNLIKYHVNFFPQCSFSKRNQKKSKAFNTFNQNEEQAMCYSRATHTHRTKKHPMAKEIARGSVQCITSWNVVQEFQPVALDQRNIWNHPCTSTIMKISIKTIRLFYKHSKLLEDDNRPYLCLNLFICLN